MHNNKEFFFPSRNLKISYSINTTHQIVTLQVCNIRFLFYKLKKKRENMFCLKKINNFTIIIHVSHIYYFLKNFFYNIYSIFLHFINSFEYKNKNKIIFVLSENTNNEENF